MDAKDSLIDENEFLIPGRLFFIARQDKGGSLSELAKAVVRVHASSGIHPIAFTDEDLAYRFIESISGRRQKPYAFSTVADLLAFLEHLKGMGEKRIGFDPGGPVVRAIPIERVIDGIRNNPR